LNCFHHQDWCVAIFSQNELPSIIKIKATMKQLLTFLFCIYLTLSNAQPAERLIKVHVSPDHVDWTYKPGEKVVYTVSVTKNEELIPNATIRYELGAEKMPGKKDSIILTNGMTKIEGGTMTAAGFQRLIVTTTIDGKEYRGLATAAYNPADLKPTVDYPADFLDFWNKTKADLAKIPLDARITLLPERCTEKTNVYHVNMQNMRDGAATVRQYGILCMPKKPGKYPALLSVPGAGVRPYNGNIAMAERGIITLEIGIHGIPVNMDPSVYLSLGAGALSGYWVYNLDDRDKYYYKRVYAGCVRAIDYIFSLPEFDGTNLAVTGGSQGGALSIVTAGLDSRVKYLGAYYPALSDVTGYLQNRAGGWPHMFDKNNPGNKTEAKIKTATYYDVVNFARQIKVPGVYTWGFNDETCPPTSMYPAYNVISAPKELWLYQETGHWTYPEQTERINNWLFDKLTKK
jgi:cephalosporin-C deacetylase